MKSIIYAAVILFLCGCQITKKEAELSTKTEKESNSVKPYNKIVNKKTITDRGLFTVHRNQDKYYFEIADSLLNKDILLVSRISKVAPNFGGGYVNAGTKTGEQLVRWQKKGDNLLLKSVSYNAVANDSLPIYQSVIANNYAPTLYNFKIAAYSPDSSTQLIEVTPFFTSDILSIGGLDQEMRKEYKVKKLDQDRSFVENIKSFPLNVEAMHEMTYIADEPPSYAFTGSIGLVMNQSFILLPEEPMTPRMYDERVGWFTISQIDYGSEALKSDQKHYIRRWKLEPKDIEAYKRGELVEPIKPIVYYLDPATPEKWRTYFKQGIEDWNKAFETAGFKNAIMAKDPPSALEDPEFSPEDVRYSIVRYVASTTRNAIGPSVADPRSGEIIESDIIWYHNHLRSYRNRYMLETGAANPSARTLNTPDEEIGEMMRMVIAHEVGHALGLPHNMKASAAYPVDSLRSSDFTQKYGIAASIMDYARYNYIAQPGDAGIRYIRQIGPYDHYSINYGYRYIPSVSTPEAEKEILSSWIKSKADSSIYQFGNGYGRFDPSAQTEGIGDDPVKASQYGLNNLKIVVDSLISWTSEDNKPYNDLEELYDEAVGVWSRYVGHVVANIGGVEKKLKTYDQNDAVFTPTNSEEQKKAMNFLLNEAFSTPDWLLNKNIISRIEASGSSERIRKLQARHLDKLLHPETLQRMLESEALYQNTYTVLEMMSDLQNGIWQELKNGKAIDVFRRNLQKAYISRMEYLITDSEYHSDYSGKGLIKTSESDIQSLARGKLQELKNKISRTRVSDTMTRYHLHDVEARIEHILNPDN